MDRISFVGLALGLAVVFLGQVFEGGTIAALVQPTAFFIVVGGTAAALLLQSSAPDVIASLRIAKWAFWPPTIDHQAAIEQIIDWSQTARRTTLLGLEKEIEDVADPFLANGLRMVINGLEPGQIEELMHNELNAWESHLRRRARFWESAAGYSPTMGILGAVMGLIHTMDNITEPAKIGAGIAVAFVATIYGIGLANLVYLPVYKKLMQHINELVLLRLIQIEGIVSIAEETNTRLIKERMQSHLASAGSVLT
ncbi:MAG: flagellar motor protein [Sphingobacteriia bacterium]|nr:flagellar motor protein [Sphingobacteriia bacterium]NCC38984.1 flagellar motor protein [Gammaproteobacteria bacterium]